MLRIVQQRDADTLHRSAAAEMCEQIRMALTLRDSVNVAVPGGRSAAWVFEAMRAEAVDWSRTHFFIIDERLVPVDHPDSNFRLLMEHFVSPLVRDGRMPPGNAHPFLLDESVPDRGARAYEAVLAEHGFRYDVILLSAGEDCHVGALFPSHHSFADPHHGFIVMDDSPKPPPGRMTSSLSMMMTAEAAVLVIAGQAKRGALRSFLDASVPASRCPAKLVLGLKKALVFTDIDEHAFPAGPTPG